MTEDHTEIAASLARIEQRVADGQDDIAEVRRHIVGNGRPGLLMDVDRLKQREISRARLAWLAVTASVGALVSVVVAAVRFMLFTD